MGVTAQDVEAVLRTVKYPGFERDIVSLGVVRGLRVDGGTVHFEIALGAGNPAVRGKIEQDARAAVQALEGVTSLEIKVLGGTAGSPSLKMAGAKPSVAAGGALDRGLIPEVERTIAVASGKGGVGKSTVAVNLAVALAGQGAQVGLLDADVYGPSIPLMMGLQSAKPKLTQDGRSIVPFEQFGVHFMSLGFMVDPQSAVIWRGPMVMKALVELLGNVTWGALDVLVVDMPPGTGDAQLTLSQKVRLAGAVIVTTPQDVALADAIKGVAMFRKVDVPVLGIVENMSYFACPHCSQRSEIFGHGGGRAEAERQGVPFLGEVPLDTAIRTAGDAGRPIVASAPESDQAKAFTEIATKILEDTPPATGGKSVFDRFRAVTDKLKK